MPDGGFLLADDAREARLGAFDSFLDEQKKRAQQAVQGASDAVQQAVQPAQLPSNGMLDRFDQWFGQQQAQQQAAPPAPTQSAQPSMLDQFDQWFGQVTAPAQQAIAPAQQALQNLTQPITQGAQDLIGAGTQKIDQAVGNQPNAVMQTSQFGDPQLTAAEAEAACGPAAAVRFAQYYGRNPTLREATDLAASVGWSQGQGMAGITSEKALMDKLNIQTHIVGADWGAIATEAQTGNPVTISTPGHYYMADGYDPQSGAFHVGRSGLDLRGGSEWMTPQQMESRMGQLQGALFADHPTVPGSGGHPSRSGVSQAVAQATGGAIDASSPESFASTFAPYAQYAAQKLGIDPSWVTAMAASESNYGKAPGNELFGVKGSGSAGSQTLATHEGEYGGTAQNAGFAAYHSPLDAVNAWVDLLKRNYQGAVNAASLPDFVHGLKQGGYFTAAEPEYLGIVSSIANRLGGTVNSALQTAQTAGQTGLGAATDLSGRVAQGAQDVMASGQSQLEAMQAQLNKLQADLSQAQQDARDRLNATQAEGQRALTAGQTALTQQLEQSQLGRNLSGTNPNQAQLDQAFNQSGVQFPNSPLGMLGNYSPYTAATGEGQRLTDERNRAIEQANPLKDVPVLGGATTFAAQSVLDPTNLFLAGGPAVARGVTEGPEAVASRMEQIYGRAGAPIPGAATEAATAAERGATGAPLAGREPVPALPEPQRALPGGRAQEPGMAAMATRGEPPPSPMAVAGEGPTMGGGTVGISQTPDFLRESLRRMYPGAINKAAAKEGSQNLIDASRDIPGARAMVKVDNTDKTISLLDQGKGMSPATMEDVFVKLGGSQKPAGAAGGMGTAIKAVMANAEDTWVRSIARDPATGEMTDSVMHGSGDDFLGGAMHRYYAKLGEMPPEELNGAPPEIHQVGEGPNGTGTLVWTKPMGDVNWDAYTLNNWISRFNRTSRINGQSVHFNVDGVDVSPDQIVRGYAGSPEATPIYEGTRPTEHLQTISVPGADIDFYGSKDTSETGYADIHLLNNGQYQADMSVQLPGNAKMPSTLVADIKSTIDPKAVGYPWTADRNSLIDTVQKSIKDYVAGDLARNIIGRENQRVGDTIKNAPMIGPVKLVDDAQLGETSAAERFNQIPSVPHYRRLASLINDLHDNLAAELEGREVFGTTITPSHLVGLGASNKWLGLNVPPSFTPHAVSEPDARGILIEPWQIWHEVEQHWGGMTRDAQLDRFVDGLVATMLHEISHNTSISGHGEDFSGVLTRVPQVLGSRMAQAITNQLRSQVKKLWDTLPDDLSNDSQQFRSAASASSLERYGTSVRPGDRPGVAQGPVLLSDQGSSGGGPRAGGADVSAGGAAEGNPPELQLARTQPTQGPGGPLAVRSGGVRAALATQTLQQSLASIKPTKAQIAAATKDWLNLDRVGARVSGLPPGVNSPRDLAALRIHVDNLTNAGTAGKDWYIDSAHKILDATGGDRQEAEKLAQLIGMMARNVDPDQNVNYAVEAWNQWKSGIPVNKVHRFDDVSREAADLLERGIPWEGRKTNSFYINLMEELDPKLLAMKKATVDQWINRAYGYVTKAPSNAQYNFMENEMRRMAAAQGLRPSQIQAMMWVGQMKLQAPNQKGEANFADALNKRMGQVGIDTDPELGKLFQDANGVDLVARAFGGLGGHSFEVPGGFQTQVAGALTAQDFPGGQQLRPASRATIEAIAAAKGHLLQLPEVGWTQVFPATTAKAANAVSITAGRLLTAREAQDVQASLANQMTQATPAAGEQLPFVLTHTEQGAWVRNTSDMPNPQFHQAVDRALAGVESIDQVTTVPVRADSNTLTNDWGSDPDGEGYLKVIRQSGREGAFRAVQDSLGPRLEGAQQRTAGTPESAAAPPRDGGTTTPGPTPAIPGLPGAEDIPTGPAGPSGPAESAVPDVRGGAQPGAASPFFAARLGGAAAGVASQEATMSDEDKQNIWARAGRDILGGAVGFAAPGVARTAIQRAGPGYADIASLRQMGATTGPLKNETRAQVISSWTKDNLLSGPGTQLTNIFSQLIELARQPAIRALSGREDEAFAGIRAAAQAVPDGLRNFMHVMTTGRSMAPPPGTDPRYTRAWMPWLRLLGATDDFFRTVGWAMGAGMEGRRLMRENPGQNLSSVLGKFSAEIDAAGQKTGRQTIFSEGVGPGQSISNWKQSLLSSPDIGHQVLGMLADAAIPFSSIPGRIWNQGLRRIPGIHEIDQLRAFGVAVKKGDTQAAQNALGELALGSVINTAIIANVASGNIRGPDDKEHPNGIRIAGQWYDYSGWGPYATAFAVPAALYEAGVKEGGKPDPDLVKAWGNATLKVFANQFFAADMIKTLNRVGEGAGVSAAAQLAGSYADRYLPQGAALTAAEQAWDPVMRDPSNKGLAQFWEREQARIPGLAERLPVQPGMTSGEPEYQRRGGLGGVLLRQQTRPVSALDAEVNRLERQGYQIPNPARPPTQVSYNGSAIPLNETEQRELTYRRGLAIDKAIGQFVNSAAYQRMTEDQKARALEVRFRSAEPDMAVEWAKMTPAAERAQRIAAGRTVAGRTVGAGSR